MNTTQLHTFTINIRYVLVVEHIISICHLAIGISNDRKGKLAAAGIIDILDPAFMRIEVIRALFTQHFRSKFVAAGRLLRNTESRGIARTYETDQFHIAFRKLGLQLSELAKLGGANRCKIVL